MHRIIFFGLMLMAGCGSDCPMPNNNPDFVCPHEQLDAGHPCN